ncbi:hypothetical protein [Roseofilum casamattae]|uniref:Flagellar assembly protein H n=1 Tax=Roseofilum casamattae BLCC-M143 TaxID=3022442 RepID=A0ABT7BV19_9CYAN|nr:hypothetical protein [Roseofilum casamattae]MDJ1183041.1 hypothetical protein [Roseofilum casamattae BLCC-M143]
MTRFIHDQFAKEYLSQLLSPLGTVETSKEVRPEVRQIDLFFTPSNSKAEERKNLGLLGKLTETPTLLEPFRNPVTPNEIRTCMMKLLTVRTELERKAKRKSLNETDIPKLWILTPTASDDVLEQFRILPTLKREEQGIYDAGSGWRMGVIVIHQLPKTPETLWLRLLGKGRVQARAIQELETLPPENRSRESVIKLVKELVALLTKRQNQDLDRNDRELIVTLTELYEEAMADVREEGLQQGLQQGNEEGRQAGEQQATLRLINNLLRTRFGEVDEELAAIVDTIASLPSEEFVPPLVQLSREELLVRFGSSE